MSNSDIVVLEETKGCAVFLSNLPFTGHCKKGIFPSDFHCDKGLSISLACTTMSGPTDQEGGRH